MFAANVVKRKLNEAQHLSGAEYTMNASQHHALRISPCHAVYGWEPEIHLISTQGESLKGEVPAAKSVQEACEESTRRSNSSQVKNQAKRQKPMSFDVSIRRI